MDATEHLSLPKRSADMRLVKDMLDDRIVYYWTDPQQQPLSPPLASITLAEEWRDDYLNDVYEGQQRRASSIDRRRYLHKRDMHQGRGNVSPLFSGGRRATDKQTRVNQDLAQAKLQAFMDEFTVPTETELSKRQES